MDTPHAILTSDFTLNGDGGGFGSVADRGLNGPDNITPVLVASLRARLPADVAPR